MVWGCFSSVGIGELVEIDTKMTGKHYVNILEENLGDVIFQQDNDPKHTNKIARQYPQSPDLNPIEHLWTILDDQIRFCILF